MESDLISPIDEMGDLVEQFQRRRSRQRPGNHDIGILFAALDHEMHRH